jgi:hypothetical protein
MSLLEQKAYLATKTIHKIISPDIEAVAEEISFRSDCGHAEIVTSCGKCLN